MRRASAKFEILLALAGLAAAALAVSTAATAADVDNGERMAIRWCASCHVVSTKQGRGNPDAAPFSAIAHRPGFDAAQLALFLLAPHPRMPDMGLSRDQAADLAAYIATQR